EGKAGFSKIFFQSIFSNETITQRNLTIFTMTLLIIALNIYVYTKLNKNLKSKYKYYSITLYIFELIYLVYMLFVYLFLFNPEETMALSSFERYFGTIGLAFIMYHILIWLE